MQKKRPIVKGKKLEALRDLGEQHYDNIKSKLDALDHSNPAVVELHNALGEAWSAFASATGANTANRSGGGEK